MNTQIYNLKYFIQKELKFLDKLIEKNKEKIIIGQKIAYLKIMDKIMENESNKN